MKLKNTLTACAVGLGLVAAAHAQEIKLNVPGQPAPAAASPAPAPAPAYSEAQLLETYGWMLGRQIGLAELEFSKADVDAMVKGLTLSASSIKDAPYDIEKIQPAMAEFLQKKQGLYMDKLRQHGLAETTAFLVELKKNPKVITLPSGLVYEVLAAGTGAGPKSTDTVKVNYTGALVNGSQFDASKPNEPVEIPLDQVIPGWTEGIQKIGKAGKIKLYVPPHLAYGDDGRPGIPPASTLIFEVELIDFHATPAPAAPAVAPVTK